MSEEIKKTLSVEERQEVCKTCPGYCCQIFHTATRVRCKGILKLEKRPEQIYNAEKVLEWFREVPDPETYGFIPGETHYYCTKYNVNTGKCVAHNERPALCREYFCPELRETGTAPSVSDGYMCSLIKRYMAILPSEKAKNLKLEGVACEQDV